MFSFLCLPILNYCFVIVSYLLPLCIVIVTYYKGLYRNIEANVNKEIDESARSERCV
jgi:hypothetical protein